MPRRSPEPRRRARRVNSTDLRGSLNLSPKLHQLWTRDTTYSGDLGALCAWSWAAPS